MGASSDTQDAYTVTDKFPYSQPVAGIGNYIRNSIKVVIDAYNGTMDFYIIDKNDPLAMTYMKIFPDLYKDGDLMPEELTNIYDIPRTYLRFRLMFIVLITCRIRLYFIDKGGSLVYT